MKKADYTKEQLIDLIAQRKEGLEQLKAQLRNIVRAEVPNITGRYFRLAATEVVHVKEIEDADDESITFSCVSIFTDLKLEEVDFKSEACRSIELDSLEWREITRTEFDEKLRLVISKINKILKP